MRQVSITATSNIFRFLYNPSEHLLFQQFVCVPKVTSLMSFGDQYGVVGTSRYIEANSRPSVHFNVTHSSVSYVVDYTGRCFGGCARMEEHRSRKLTHKEWRRIARKERRRRIRRLTAQERDANEERLRAALENNMEYLKFYAEKEKQQEEKKTQEEKEHAERERLWLEEEVNT